jgi:hypothetical protein
MRSIRIIYSLKISLASALILSTCCALAVSDYYQCTIQSDAYIKSNGALDLLNNSARVGQAFTVVKASGAVIGDVMDAMQNPRVVALGGEKNAYKVIWEQDAVGKNAVFVDYLSIDESAKGAKKPFGFFSGSLLLTGFCASE